MIKKLFITLIVFFILLNTTDCVLTYYGMEAGFYELNPLARMLFEYMGVMATLVLKFCVVPLAMLGLYLTQKPESQQVIASCTLAFVCGIYCMAIYFNIIQMVM